MSTRASKYQRDLMHASDPHCTYCGRFLVGQHLPTVDHVRPLSRGGADLPENLRLACNRCNNLKGDLTIPEFRELLSWMLERLSALPAG